MGVIGATVSLRKMLQKLKFLTNIFEVSGLKASLVKGAYRLPPFKRTLVKSWKISYSTPVRSVDTDSTAAWFFRLRKGKTLGTSWTSFSAVLMDLERAAKKWAALTRMAELGWSKNGTALSATSNAKDFDMRSNSMSRVKHSRAREITESSESTSPCWIRAPRTSAKCPYNEFWLFSYQFSLQGIF